jgi:RNA polymerase sigma-70 factor (ECF subfamily)
MTSNSVVEIEPVVRTATDDDALVGRARRGDSDAFGRLIEPRAQRLLRMATVILGNDADAYEAAQEALLAAWVHLPSLKDVYRFDAWLNRTLVNKCRDALRKRKRVREIDLSNAGDVATADTNDEIAAHAAVLSAFDRLSVEHRQILVLHHVEDLPLDHIAHELSIPVGTAKSRLWSARRSLERALEAEL